MSGFDKREAAEEGRFALDQELRFKANARRNKLLGLWAAEKLGKSGEAAATAVKSFLGEVRGGSYPDEAHSVK